MSLENVKLIGGVIGIVAFTLVCVFGGIWLVVETKKPRPVVQQPTPVVKHIVKIPDDIKRCYQTKSFSEYEYCRIHLN